MSYEKAKAKFLRDTETFRKSLTTKTITPTAGKILIAVLPKDQTIGGIIMPGKQNKPNYEGLVLRTYKAYTQHKMIGDVSVSVGVAPSVYPGDLVLFPHFEGLPIDFIDDNRGDFRIIREDALFATLGNYALDWQRANAITFPHSGPIDDFFTKWMNENYFVLPKKLNPVTTSGVGQSSL